MGRNGGISTETSYPYSSSSGDSGSCQSGMGMKAAIQVKAYTMVKSDEDAMAAWLVNYGPLSISIDAMTDLWWAYTGGVLSTCNSVDVDHAVLAVGFGVASGQMYWIVKNSWGQAWGEEGYIRLERGTNQCGITYQPVGALVAGSPTPSPSPDGWTAYSDYYFHSSQQIDQQDDMTVDDAKMHCASLAGCVGFTRKGPSEVVARVCTLKTVLTWSLQLVGLHFGRPRSLCQLLSQLRSQPLLRCQALCLCQHHLHLRFVPWMLNMCFQMKDEVSVFGQVVFAVLLFLLLLLSIVTTLLMATLVISGLPKMVALNVPHLLAEAAMIRTRSVSGVMVMH